MGGWVAGRLYKMKLKLTPSRSAGIELSLAICIFGVKIVFLKIWRLSLIGDLSTETYLQDSQLCKLTELFLRISEIFQIEMPPWKPPN